MCIEDFVLGILEKNSLFSSSARTDSVGQRRTLDGGGHIFGGLKFL